MGYSLSNCRPAPPGPKEAPAGLQTGASFSAQLLEAYGRFRRMAFMCTFTGRLPVSSDPVQDALSSFIELAQAISCFAIAALSR